MGLPARTATPDRLPVNQPSLAVSPFDRGWRSQTRRSRLGDGLQSEVSGGSGGDRRVAGGADDEATGSDRIGEEVGRWEPGM